MRHLKDRKDFSPASWTPADRRQAERDRRAARRVLAMRLRQAKRDPIYGTGRLRDA